MNDNLKRAAEYLAKSHYVVALTGAGVSAESGIPPFRGSGGLWGKHDPSLAHIDAFTKDPHRVWEMARELIAVARAAHPNPAHRALARMEEVGRLEGVITQNIDGLHKRAGSRCVIELHGSLDRLRCLICGCEYDGGGSGPVIDGGGSDPVTGDPLCPVCGSVLKPGMVFFGEMLPFSAIGEARLMASSADAMLVVGTSAVVNPAAELPYLAKKNRARIIEVNISTTGLTNDITDVFIRGRAGEVLPELVKLINNEVD
ncbi:MAG TPA: NAD-dependent deacylase [Spirochaetota bacterium]|nr:NAD-dependent deacylase [Spirochaetota bacterium]HOD16053.1 NAD-dependent deacylase [Spirochaetota bacterium]HPG52129.1 NAD-dependent deacylase [Spirochaetota bacterium]HPN14265.1 NAD-dependent deacylase [Spirochaetota bacterium]HQL82701.1 NAD-dependent deacylase [Spirochaetota bacterium]